MHVISRKKLREFWENRPDARSSLESWFVDVKHAEWQKPDDIKAVYRNASIIGNSRVVFNIKGNKYRLVISVQYAHRIVLIRFVGTHQEYDRINAETI
ncbi:MAG: type II toxin-antitoxin system HigB family toxin [Chloroflexi bacterium]|nr:type II toxin-antitoxin system HigB family toxin [Chloroflexota bacterium]